MALDRPGTLKRYFKNPKEQESFEKAIAESNGKTKKLTPKQEALVRKIAELNQKRPSDDIKTPA